MANTPRAAESRVATARPPVGGFLERGRLDIDVSALPSNLEPTWIREEVRGQYEGDNVQSALERGYVPVKPADIGYKTHVLPGAKGSDRSEEPLIRRGGMVLMARERRIAEEERAYYAAETELTLRSVAKDTAAPKDGKNFQDIEPEVSSQMQRAKGRFSE